MSYVSDTVGGLTQDEQRTLARRPGGDWEPNWPMGQAMTRVDNHAIQSTAYPTIQGHIDGGASTGTVTVKQEIHLLGADDLIFATHTIIFKFGRVDPNPSCNPDYFPHTPGNAHVAVDKDGEHNPDIWPAMPNIPCR
jgi:hypothetical protein